MVRQEEAASGGDATPGAAAEERFGVEADEDLPDDDDLVLESDEERCHCCCWYGVRHGRRLGAHPRVVRVATEGDGNGEQLVNERSFGSLATISATWRALSHSPHIAFSAIRHMSRSGRSLRIFFIFLHAFSAF